jgi:hypothetical protein
MLWGPLMSRGRYKPHIIQEVVVVSRNPWVSRRLFVGYASVPPQLEQVHDAVLCQISPYWSGLKRSASLSAWRPRGSQLRPLESQFRLIFTSVACKVIVGI